MAYELSGFSFLGFEIGANQFSIKFYKILHLKCLINVGMVPRKPAKVANPG